MIHLYRHREATPCGKRAGCKASPWRHPGTRVAFDCTGSLDPADTNGVVIITQEQPINVIFALPEVSLDQVLTAIHQNNALPVEAWDRDNQNKLSDGTLLAVDNQLNTLTGTYRDEMVTPAAAKPPAGTVRP